MTGTDFSFLLLARSAEFSEQMAAEDIEASLPTDATPESKIKLAKILASGGLSKISRLDTCVTVVDCTTVSLHSSSSSLTPCDARREETRRDNLLRAAGSSVICQYARRP